jgi:hypothetical protein
MDSATPCGVVSVIPFSVIGSERGIPRASTPPFNCPLRPKESSIVFTNAGGDAGACAGRRWSAERSFSKTLFRSTHRYLSTSLNYEAIMCTDFKVGASRKTTKSIHGSDWL